MAVWRQVFPRDEMIPRSQKNLTSWQFQFDQDELGEKQAWFKPGLDRGNWMPVKVPGAWDFYSPAFRDYEGVGWYFTRIPAAWLDPRLWQSLHFASVHNRVKVWLNGKLAAQHGGGYTPFDVELGKLRPGRKPLEVVLRVDNRTDYDCLPGGKIVEWVQYGGILQPVTLHSAAPARIADLKVVAVPKGKGAHILCKLTVVNEGPAQKGLASVQVLGLRQERLLSLPAQGRTETEFVLEPRAAAAWDLDHPVLHHLQAGLKADGVAVDRVSERFGIRSITASKTKLLLNGKPILVKGVCRYDEFEGYGPCAPREVIRKDLLAIKKAGANFVRTHYPYPPVHLELMDEIGLLCMEEVPLNWWRPGWRRPPKEHDHDKVIPLAVQALEAMVRRDKNHPCVVIWSMANESGTDDAMGVTAMRRLIKRARELDTSRLVTFVAPGTLKGHLAFRECDVLGLNDYKGLFQGREISRMEDMKRLVYEPTRKDLQVEARRFPGKPILLTEFGAHGMKGIRGPFRYSEDFQREVLRSNWKAVEASGSAGGIVWVWADYHHQRDFVGGTKYSAPFGPFGLVTVDRKPKKALEAMAKLWGGRV
jgi:beta-glucuronidase